MGMGMGMRGGRGGGSLIAGRGGAWGSQEQTLQQLQALQQQLLVQQLLQGAGGAGAAAVGAQGPGVSNGADMMDDDASFGNGALPQQQQQNGGMSRSSDSGIVPEVWLDEEHGNVIATLKGTDIVTVSPEGEIKLQTGGWHTPSTLAAMNEVLNVVGLQVLAEGNPHDAQWKVATGHSLIRFHEGILIHSKSPIDYSRGQLILTAFQNPGATNDLAAAASAASNAAAMAAGLSSLPSASGLGGLGAGSLGMGSGTMRAGGLGGLGGLGLGAGSTAIPGMGTGLLGGGGMGLGTANLATLQALQSQGGAGLAALSGGFPAAGAGLGGLGGVATAGASNVDLARRLARQQRLV
ncbi:hypothetical protein DUNSADRAFT_14009 [Dunaliella salina]|uniref:Uncharacterized protein n=1 Tax=Dunaliella salina TaxID=3046 RepID=A0ABQ7H2U7_DUNSA|nr:hypothetical protein DUNSADRAFT_14009 [Dunaliella salina]|eukprot:KAF5841179.1 hypothetical protein DUNSADRAFT_14009 [Dunaliella salina]